MRELFDLADASHWWIQKCVQWRSQDASWLVPLHHWDDFQRGCGCCFFWGVSAGIFRPREANTRGNLLSHACVVVGLVIVVLVEKNPTLGPLLTLDSPWFQAPDMNRSIDWEEERVLTFWPMSTFFSNFSDCTVPFTEFCLAFTDTKML